MYEVKQCTVLTVSNIKYVELYPVYSVFIFDIFILKRPKSDEFLFFRGEGVSHPKPP